MFPTAKTPFSEAVRRGLDRAVQFATLGEFGVSAPEPRPRTSSSRPGRRPAPRATWRPDQTAAQVRPATAAARRRGPSAAPVKPAAATGRANASPTPVPARAALRELSLRPSGGAARSRRRKRAGQPPVRPQRCLVAERTAR